MTIFFFQNPIKSDDNTHNSKKESIDGSQKANDATIYYIPLLIPILYIFTMSFASGISGFLYPIKSEIIGFHPSSVYFLTIFSTSAQSLALYLAGILKIKLLKVLSIISTFSLAGLAIIYEINDVYLIFIILFALLGFLAGILYGAASRFFLYLNVIKQTSIYSSVSESLLGVAYFITLVSAGFMADINLEVAFYTFALLLAAISFINLILIRKIKNDMKH